jgi:hypothetical protein
MEWPITNAAAAFQRNVAGEQEMADAVLATVG